MSGCNLLLCLGRNMLDCCTDMVYVSTFCHAGKEYTMTINFRSDNEAPVHPSIMEALQRANTGDAHAYGADALTAKLDQTFSDLFGQEVIVFPLVSGTAANAMTLAQCVPFYGAVFCHREAHLHVDECGAGEFYSHGAKLFPLDGGHGKLTPDSIESALKSLGLKGDHDPLPSLISVTQATEWGTVYSRSELSALSELARQRDLTVHMDGARFANALVSLGCTAGQMTAECGIDVLSFGATKNGAMAAEALIFLDPMRATQFGRVRMKGGHLLSKMRYVSAQLLAYLEDDLWLDLAQNANQGARTVASALDGLEGARLATPCQANEVFCFLDDGLHQHLQSSNVQYHAWPGYDRLYRMVIPYTITKSTLSRFDEACASWQA